MKFGVDSIGIKNYISLRLQGSDIESIVNFPVKKLNRSFILCLWNVNPQQFQLREVFHY
jgi:hypothetical protein